MSVKSLMIFAAGKGTRMGALTQDTPKPMVEVGGRPLIDHALALARDASFETIVANVHYKPDALMSLLKAQGVAIADERPKLLETGGGLKAALPLLGGGPVATRPRRRRRASRHQLEQIGAGSLRRRKHPGPWCSGCASE